MSALLGGSGFGGIGGGLAGLMGQGNNPFGAGNQYWSQIGGANQYLAPYQQMGQQAGNELSNVYSGLLNNPGAFTNQIGSNFHQSPGFNFALNQAMQGGNRGMAAGGLAGSPSNQMQNMQTATGMGNQNYYNYLNNAENLFGQGMQGAQGMYGIGENAGNNMAGNMAQMLAMQGEGAYSGQAGMNQAQGQGFSNLFGGIGDLISQHFL